LFSQLYEQGDNGETYLWPGTNGNVLCAYRNRVAEDTEDGKPVVFVLQNHGAAARRIRIETPLKNCVLREAPQLDSAGHRIFLKYDYDRASHGTPADVKVSFESLDGYQGTHTYRTVHGEFIFERVDPV
jgi:hypothetical protein